MTHIRPDFKSRWDLKDALQRGEIVVILPTLGEFADKRGIQQIHSCDHGWHAMAEIREVNGKMRVVKVVS